MLLDLETKNWQRWFWRANNYFDLSQDRKELFLNDVLDDKIVNSDSEEDSITFAKNFTMITDLEMNPYVGSLFVVSQANGDSGEEG